MSANNWTRCPKCQAVAIEQKKQQAKRLDESYGKVSIQQFEEMQAEFRKEMVLKDTLAEYYELGISDSNKFFVSYSADCRTCGWEYKYNFLSKEVV